MARDLRAKRMVKERENLEKENSDCKPLDEY